AAYEQLVREINEYHPGNLILQAKSDHELTRSLSEVEAELTANPSIDEVVIDPHNNSSDVYGCIENRYAGEAAEQTAPRYENIDVVVIDPFNNISDVYGRNANRTAGGAAEQAARRFEQIVGEFDVVGLTTVQATVENTQKDKEKIREGKRELKLPTRDQVKTT